MEISLEQAAGRKNNYQIFMALANHIGHDKRGNLTYVRDKKGNEIVEEVEETVKEYNTSGKLILKRQTTLRKVIDDNTLQIADAFRKWLTDQI